MTQKKNTLKIGNLAFAESQQPGPLVSIGQNVLNKLQAQAALMPVEFKGHDQYSVALFSNLFYGFTDELTFLVSVPTAVPFAQDDHRSYGVSDVILQLEYAFYTKYYTTYYDQATFIASMTLPTGSATKNPPTGTGANSFFLGGTLSRMGIDWFYFISGGGIMNASSHGQKHGDQALYQCGIGRRILNTEEWLLDWMVEFDGYYACRDRDHGVSDPNSGGNVIYITPSLWLSSTHVIYQIGIGFPVQQTLFGHQNKNHCLIIGNFAWTF